MLSHSVLPDCNSLDHSQTPPSTEFSRQEYWSGLPFPSPGDLPNPGTEPTSVSAALADRLFITEPHGKGGLIIMLSVKSSLKCLSCARDLAKTMHVLSHLVLKISIWDKCYYSFLGG